MMADYPVPTKRIEEAMCAKTNLHVFGTLIAILEGGTLSKYSGNAPQRIIAICHKEQQRQLKLMDKAVEAVNKNAERAAIRAAQEGESNV